MLANFSALDLWLVGILWAAMAGDTRPELWFLVQPGWGVAACTSCFAFCLCALQAQSSFVHSSTFYPCGGPGLGLPLGKSLVKPLGRRLGFAVSLSVKS